MSVLAQRLGSGLSVDTKFVMAKGTYIGSSIAREPPKWYFNKLVANSALH